ncbi:MAG TPA: M13-type metalloendopeptidase [Opitutaceae bacterium]|nr:M13-type metalloendopeptidase [Opitutaceae bacterium]
MNSLVRGAFVVCCVVVLGGVVAGAESTLTAFVDPSVRPQDDLYLAVNGKWLATTEIPPDKSNYGAFTKLDDDAVAHVRELLESASASKQEPGSDLQKIGDMYRSFMDEEKIEARGVKPVLPLLAEIDRIAKPEDVARKFGEMARSGLQVPFAFDVDVDRKNSVQYLAAISQSGTALPDRDYYLLDDPKYKEGREAYLAYIEKILAAIDVPAAEGKAIAQRILALETKLAAAQWTRTERRDPLKTYSKTATKDLRKVSEDFIWPEFWQGLGLADLNYVNVEEPSFTKAVGGLLRSEPLNTWKEYLKVKVLDGYAEFLNKDLVQAHFELYGKVLAGIPQDKTRWRKAVDLISGAGAGDFGVLGDVVGRAYVQKYFPPEAKTRMDSLVANLLVAYDQSLTDLTWMTQETKEKARSKLHKYTNKIGYTKKWRDYSDLTITPDDLFANIVASQKHEYNYVVQKLGKPVDKGEWHMTPQTVNAYYNPTGNEVVFPAAILQPPFFDLNEDDAVNYGAIGAVIGHEISHGFDDKGSQYDGDGNLNNWWTEADRKAFEDLTKKLVDQYAAYEPLPGKHVNGELTLGENIADLSGLSIAYKAYKHSLGGKTAPVIAGLTGDQRFFYGWARIWQRKYREAEMVRRLVIDPHSPSQFRANGAPINSDAFAEAFQVKPGDKMYKAPEARIRIW